MKLLTLVLITLLSLLAASCTETTTISGMVTDSGTGLPLEGVEVTLDLSTLDNIGRAHAIDVSKMVTGTNGQYAVSVENNTGEGGCVLAFVKDGYIQPYPLYPDEGDCIEYNRALNPIDGMVKLTIRNISGATGINYRVTSDKMEGQEVAGPNGGYRFSVPQGTFVEHYVKVPGGDDIRVAWDTINMNHPKHHGSVFCPHKDTVFFQLDF